MSVVLVLVLAIAALFQGPAFAAEDSATTKASIRAFVESLNEASMNFYSGAPKRMPVSASARYSTPNLTFRSWPSTP